jgi:poly(ADP-ribose) glycohydrolase ARH3
MPYSCNAPEALPGKLVTTGIDLRSKFLGGMIGSALGDAIGELAFRYPERASLFPTLDRLHEFRYTDDTAMAIGLAESLIEKGRIDPQHLGRIFSENFEREPWRGYASGPPAIFIQVERRGITFTEAARGLFGGTGSLGNGAAMRIVPLGLFFHQHPDIYEQACASAQVTHAHPVGMDGAAVQALAVARATRLNPGQEFPRKEFVKDLILSARTIEIREKMLLVEEMILRGISPDAAARQLGHSVAVHESMPFALYSFMLNPMSFEECIFCAIMNGGDRDTLGAMAGAISGAYLGVEAIPKSWRKKLENLSYIEHLSSKLLMRFLDEIGDN